MVVWEGGCCLLVGVHLRLHRGLNGQIWGIHIVGGRSTRCRPKVRISQRHGDVIWMISPVWTGI